MELENVKTVLNLLGNKPKFAKKPPRFVFFLKHYIKKKERGILPTTFVELELRSATILMYHMYR